MSERKVGAAPESSLEARVDAVLREMVASDGPADLRLRVMAALAQARPGRPLPYLTGPRLVVAASLVAVAGAVLFLGPDRVREAKPRADRIALGGSAAVAEVAPQAAGPAVGPASPERSPIAQPTRGARRGLRQEAATGEPPDEGRMPLLEIPRIEGTDPLALAPVWSATAAEPAIVIPAIEIATLSAEPASSGSY